MHKPAPVGAAPSTVYHLRQAELKSLNSSSSSDAGDLEEGPTAFGAHMSSQYHGSEGGESSQSAGQGPSREFSMVSTNSERHLMKEQLQHVKAKLNAMSGGPNSNAPATAAPGQLMGAPSLALPSSSVLVGPGQHLIHSQGGKSLGVPGHAQPDSVAPTGVEKLLGDIASRLSSIEGMYSDMSSKLLRVDTRTAENERSVRELQHISAGAMNETVRLVDIMVPSSNRGSTTLSLPRGTPTLTPPGKSRGRHVTGQLISSPGPAAAQLDYLPAQVTSTVHQHASQIHKLVAGLDFLEQHIMRQDQVIESVQKQLLLVSHEQDQASSSLMAPNEMALKLHDLHELVGKLRSHMYKVDKRAGGTESSIQVLSSQVEHLTLRLEMLEQARVSTPAGPGSSLFSVKEDAYARADITSLSESHADLRHTVATYGREMHMLSQQVQQLLGASPAQQPATPTAQHSSAQQELYREVQELRSQLEELRSDVSQDSCAASHTTEQLCQVQAETASLKQKLDGVVGSLEEQLRRLQKEADQARTMTRSTSTSVPPDGINPATVPAALERVQLNMEVLTEQLASLSGIVSERVSALSDDVNDKFAGLKEATALDNSKWHNLETEVQSLKEAVEGLAAESLASQSVMRASHRATTEALMTEVQQLKQNVTALSGPDSDPPVVSSQLAAIVSQQTASFTALQLQIDSVRADSTTSQASLQALLQQVDGQQQQVMQQVTDLLAQVVRERGGVEEALQVVKADLQGGLGGVLTQVQQCIEDMTRVTQQDISQAVHKSQAETQQVSQELQQLQTSMQTWHQSMRVVSDQVTDLAAKLDVDLGKQLSDLVTGNTSAHTALEQLSLALSRVVAELDNVKGTLSDCQARLGDKATTVQVVGVVSVVEELQGMCKETAVGLETVRTQLSRDYINHEKLGAIFAAREDMRSAVHKLENVFSGAPMGQAVPDSSVPLYDVSVNSDVQELRKQVAELQSQMQLALYRSANSVRQEQLGSMQQAMLSLELQLKEQHKDKAVAGVTEPLADVAARSADVEHVIERELDSIQGAASRLKDLEAQVVALQRFSRRVAPVLSDDLPMLRKSVQDLQLMLFDLRGSRLGVGKTPHGGNSMAGYAPSLSPEIEERESSPDVVVIGAFTGEDEQEQDEGVGPEEVAGRQGSGRKVSLRSYHSFAAPDGNLADELSEEEFKQEAETSQEVASLASTVAQLSAQLIQIEAALSSRVQALETGEGLKHVPGGFQADLNKLEAQISQLQELPERVSELRDVVETIHVTVQPSSPRHSQSAFEFDSGYMHSQARQQAGSIPGPTSAAAIQAFNQGLEAVRDRLADLESRVAGLSTAGQAGLASGRSSSSGPSVESYREMTESLAWLSTRLLEIDAQSMSQAASLSQLTLAVEQVEPLKDAMHKLVDHVTSLSSLVSQPGTTALLPDQAATGSTHRSGSGEPDLELVNRREQLDELSSKVVELEQQVQALRASAPGGVAVGLGSSGAGGLGGSLGSDLTSSLDGQALASMEGRMAEYGKVLQAMRNRIVALQEYVDSTQGMVKELHTVHGSVLMRLSALESTTGGGSTLGGGVPVEGLRQVQVDLQSLESKFLAFHASQAQLSASLEALKSVGDRLADLDARDGQIADKVAAIGQTMPVIAGQLKTLERSLQARLTACCTQLEGLSSVLAEISRMEKQDSKNPFSGIGGAGNNPVVKLLEAKVELLRSALSNVAQALAAEFKNQDAQY